MRSVATIANRLQRLTGRPQFWPGLPRRHGETQSEGSTHAAQRAAWADPAIIALLVVYLLLFAGGSAAHLGLAIPVGIGTWVEPWVLPAAIVEGLGAAGLAVTLIAFAARVRWAGRLAGWVLWYCFAGVLWGMSRLAVGAIPEARTVSNDFLHIAMTLVTTAALVWLASRRA